MVFTESFNYVVFDNPVSKVVTSTTKSVLGPVVNWAYPRNEPVPTTIIQMVPPEQLWEIARKQGPYVQLAGISGALAVALGAYGAHKKYPKDRIEELKPIYETGSRYHFFHSLALLAVPLSRSPKLTSALLISGMTLFSGACYYHAFSGEKKFDKLAPFGGTLLIIAWLSMIY